MGVKLSSLRLRVEIETDGGQVVVMCRRPTVGVLDKIQKTLKETDKETMESLTDVVTYQLIPLLVEWNLTDDDDTTIPFEPEVIIQEVPYDIITAILTSINKAVKRDEEPVDAKN